MRDIQRHLASTLSAGAQHGDHFEDHRRGSRGCPACGSAAHWRSPLPGGLPRRDPGRWSAPVHRVASRSAHIAVGAGHGRYQARLGYLGPGPEEGASFWAHVCAELANRGVKDVLIVEGAPPARERSARGNVTGSPAFPRRTQAVLAPGHGPHLCGPPDPLLDAVRLLQGRAGRSRPLSRPICTASNQEAAWLGSDRLLRVRHGGQVSPDGDDLGAGLGAVHSLPGQASDAQARHLSPTSWEVPPPPTASRLRTTSCARITDEPRPLPLSMRR